MQGQSQPFSAARTQSTSSASPSGISNSSLPNTSADIQEAYEAAATALHQEHVRGVIHPPDAPLAEEELKSIFSGAPHYLLERAQRTQWFPHVVFPWDETTGIQNLRDRRPFQHSSYGLSTLHAHLPVSNSTGKPMDVEDLLGYQPIKRPSFDIGVFEVPNMLASRAKEPGCVGFRYYLEIPVSPKLKEDLRNPPDLFNLDSHHGLHIKRMSEPYSACRPGLMLDRVQLIKEGPPLWKRLGIRNCSMKNISERLEQLCALRYEVLFQAKPLHLLSKESISELHHNLFSTFLYPPTGNQEYGQKSCSLKVQIETLMKVLAVRGAWFDFSLIDCRIRAGQILWESPPHQDGDFGDILSDPNVDPGQERKWLLIQLVLTAELIGRLDAAVRHGVVTRSKEFTITQQDIYQMNDMRNDQMDWGIICLRRAFEGLIFKYAPAQTTEPARDQQGNRYLQFRQRFTHGKHKDKPDVESAWDCVTLPRFPRIQLEGLFVFANSLHWPDFDHLKVHLEERLNFAMSDPAIMARAFSSPLFTDPVEEDRLHADPSSYENSKTLHIVYLQPPRATSEKITSNSFGGWISRSWISGFVLPGEAVNDLLMATLLENDPNALHALGPVTNLYGGFVFSGRSWWSKMCVVSRVLSCLDGSDVCMGWVYSPVVPINEHGQPISEQWLEVEIKGDPHYRSVPRIYQTTRVLYESSPLGGGGKLTPSEFSLPMDDPDVETLQQTQVRFENVMLSFHAEQKDPSRHFPQKTSAHASFTIIDKSNSTSWKVVFPLANNCHFISSFTCLPPQGYAAHSSGKHKCAPSSNEKDADCNASASEYHRHFFPRIFDDEHLDNTSYRERSSSEVDRRKQRKSDTIYRLPGHPLHTSFFPHSYVPLELLPNITSFPPPPEAERIPATSKSRRSNQSGRPDRGFGNRRLRRNHTYIIDARGSRDKEAFVRAWCIAVCTNAVVSRVGRTCLACSIREAKAADVDVVIRVGSCTSSLA